MARLEDDLLRPENYPPPRPSSLRLVETPLSLVFLGDREAWKIRRPLRGRDLDCTDPASRERLCHEEMRLNRRLAPDVYRGVLPVRRDGEGHSFTRGGEVVEFAVRMRLLPEERSARRLLASGRLDFHHAEVIGLHMADFYGVAAKVPRPGAAETLAERLEEDLGEFEAVEPRVAPTGGGEEIRRFLRGFLRRGAVLLRAREGRILEAHGDLRLDHVYLEEHHRDPTVVDAVDHHERFGGLDPAADLALLVADLEADCRADLGERLLAVVAAATGDFGMYPVLDFHACWRALARARVLALEAANPRAGAAGARARLEEARRLFAIALLHARPRSGRDTVIAVGGALGTGKSTLAAALSRLLSLPVVAPGPGPCSTGADVRRERSGFLGDAEAVLFSRRGVILDAPFRTRGQRATARRLAVRRGRPFLFVETRCPAGVLRERLRARPPGAGSYLPERGGREFDPGGEGHPWEHLVVETTEEAGRSAERVKGFLEEGESGARPGSSGWGEGISSGRKSHAGHR